MKTLRIFRDTISAEKINTGRQVEVDLARGLAVLFMIWVHVLEIFGAYEIQDSIFAGVFEFLGGPPAAPVFMLLMGVSIAYSKQNNPGKLIWRGLMIMLLGYVLNFAREIIPLYIGLEFDLLSKIDLLPYTFETMLLQVDILQFAGLALVFLGLLSGLRIPYWVYLPLAFVFALANPFVWDIQGTSSVSEYFLQLLWGWDYYVFFPFFTWIFYPLVGVVVGDLLIRAKDKGVFYQGIFVIGLLVLLIGVLVLLTDAEFHLGDYYRHAIGGNLWMTGFVLAWWALIYFTTNRFPLPQALQKQVTFWSRNVTVLYFIHWVIIGWSVLILGYESISFAGLLLLMILFTVLSDRLTYAWVITRTKSN